MKKPSNVSGRNFSTPWWMYSTSEGHGLKIDQEAFDKSTGIDNIFGTNYEESVQNFLNYTCYHMDVTDNTSKTPSISWAFLSVLLVSCLLFLFLEFDEWGMPIGVHLVSTTAMENILAWILFITFGIVFGIFYHRRTQRYIKRYGKEYFRRIVRQTIELCLIRRYFGLFEYNNSEGYMFRFEFWHDSSVSHFHIIPLNSNFTGKMKSYWNKDKDIKYNIEFKNGNEYGLWKAWYKNGQIAYEQNFKITEYTKSGIRHGKARCWNKKGKIIVDLNYIDGKVSFEEE